MHKAHKYRIYPTKEQEITLTNWLGQTRYIWNKFLEQNIARYRLEKKFIFIYELKRQLPVMKKELDWLSAPSGALQAVAFQFDLALRNGYKKKMGFPKFKCKNKSNTGIKISQVGAHIKLNGKTIKIPKLGLVKLIKHRETEGRLIAITVTRDVDQWYVSCLCDVSNQVQQKQITEQSIIGLDLGLKSFAVTSDAEIIANPKIDKQYEKKLTRRQQQLSKKQKGSANRNKARIQVAKLYRKIRFKRRDFLHKLSAQIANENSAVIVEDLNVKGMMSNHKLAKAIHDASWSQFVGYLAYKLEWGGGQLVKIGRFEPSSKTCSACGNVQDIKLSQRTFTCNDCNFTCDRDLNAAFNIKAFGIKKLNKSGTGLIYACGDTTIGELSCDDSRFVSAKQEAAIL